METTNRAKLTVRPTTQEHEQLKKRAASFGYKSMSRYLIDRSISEGVQLENVHREKIERLLFELRKVGNNLNQIALQMNRGYQNYSRSHLDRTFSELERVLKIFTGGEQQ
jgi:hypothetical protein